MPVVREITWGITYTTYPDVKKEGEEVTGEVFKEAV
jgi:hypothetical protein